jgi:hypothetical protein
LSSPETLDDFEAVGGVVDVAVDVRDGDRVVHGLDEGKDIVYEKTSSAGVLGC